MQILGELKRAVVTVSLALVAMAGCDSSTAPVTDLGPVPDSHFTTDTTGYIAERVPNNTGIYFQYRFRVITRFENRGHDTLYLGRCFPESLRPLFGVPLDGSGNAESAFDPVWACVGHDQQFRVAPGAVRVDTFTVTGPTAFDGHTKEPFGITSGRFRMYLDVRRAPGDGASTAPDSLKYSNPFIVRTAG